jgi:hypothetical protein
MRGMNTYPWNVEQIETTILEIINCSEASNREIGTRKGHCIDRLPAEREHLSQYLPESARERNQASTHAKSLSRNDPFAKVGNVLVSVDSPITI